MHVAETSPGSQPELFKGYFSLDTETSELVSSTGTRLPTVLNIKTLQTVSDRVANTVEIVRPESLSRLGSSKAARHAIRNSANLVGPMIGVIEKGLSESGDELVVMHQINLQGSVRALFEAAEAQADNSGQQDPVSPALLNQFFNSLHHAGTASVTGEDGGAVELAGEGFDPEFCLHMMELVFNAIHWRSSDITISQGVITSKDEECCNYSAFVVSDNGPGMSSHQIPGNMTHGVTNRKDGTGSGLGLLCRYVKDRGGFVTVESKDVASGDGSPRTAFTTSAFVPVHKWYSQDTTVGTRVHVMLPE